MVHTRHQQSSPDSPKERKSDIVCPLVKGHNRLSVNGVDKHMDDLTLEDSAIATAVPSKHSPARSSSSSVRGKLNDMFENRRRRSGREKRLIYETFNQSEIANVYLGFDELDADDAVSSRRRKSMSSSPESSKLLSNSVGRKKRGRRPKRTLVEMADTDEALNNTSSNMISPIVGTDERPHDDMYTRIKRQRRDSRRVTYEDFITPVRPRKRSRVCEETADYPRRSLRPKNNQVSDSLKSLARGRKPKGDRSPVSQLGDQLNCKESQENNELHDPDVIKAGNVNEVEDEEEEEEEVEEEEEEGDEDEDEEGSSESSEEAPRKYSLRERRGPPVPIYQPDFGERRLRRTRISTLLDRRTHPSSSVCRPRGRQVRSRLHRSTVHNRGNSSTSSSSSDSEEGTSADEARFQRRKAKSMARARKRCLPMNFTEDDLKEHVLRDRSIAGASLADVEPMTVDKNITFESVGGLDHVIRSLKEMVLFPLLYSEVFENFNVAPPRGVLFHGPPGTGKTLVARALANVCSQESNRKVAFFMRKGADCLSKWVGESERQLRLLFNEAYTMRPSIIFFDEIDGLAPVRSTRQDQIHSSIVSTLLALLDGLDSRGEVVVIGATNRLDAIDPALRRPGRFDREFFFPLPREAARLQILQIHTAKWPRPLSGNLLDRLAKATSGYCGADLKALCTEAVLSGLRRRYPQVYISKVKLQLNMNEIEVSENDFQVAMESIVPAGERVECSPSRPLSEAVTPLVKEALDKLLDRIRMEFPAAAQLLRLQAAGEDDAGDGLIAEDAVDESGKVHSWSRMVVGGAGPKLLCRPRLLLMPEDESGNSLNRSWDERSSDDGQMVVPVSNTIDQHLLPALFHHLEGIHVFTVDTPTLFHVSARTPEESLSQLWREAMRLAPSIIYIPHINELLSSLPVTVTHCLVSLMRGGDPTARIFILATVAESSSVHHHKVSQFFTGCVHRCSARPSMSARRLFFHDLFITWPSVPPPQKKLTARRALEVLPPAPESDQKVGRKLNEKEAAQLFEQEEVSLCQLRILLREVLSKLMRDRRFGIFARPVDRDEVPDYYDIIKNPMDLSTICHKLDTHQYETTQAFLDDINQICSNALEYNPDTTPADRELRHRACCLRDCAKAEIKGLIADEFIERCEYITNSRKRRGVDGAITVPNYYITKPPNAQKSGGGDTLNQATPVVRDKNTPQQVNTSGSVTPSGSLGSVPSAATGHRLSRRLKQLDPETLEPNLLHNVRRRRSRNKRSECTADGSNMSINVEDGSDLQKQTLEDANRLSNSVSTPSPTSEEVAGVNPNTPTSAVPETSQDHYESKQSEAAANRISHEKKDDKPIPRLTRGLAASNPLAERALAILKEPTPDLIIPSGELTALLERCVRGTDGWSVSHMEHLYSRLASRLISFERVWDRTRLTSEYEEVLFSFNT